MSWEHVQAYHLQIEQARFADHLSVQWQIPRRCGVPPAGLSPQPVVENAIKHGISQMLGALCLTLRRRGIGGFCNWW